MRFTPSMMGDWILISDAGGIRKYRPSGESMFLKKESSLKFADEIYVLPSSAVTLTLSWVDGFLSRVVLRVALRLVYDGPTITTNILWFNDDYTAKPFCQLTCFEGRNEVKLNKSDSELLNLQLRRFMKHIPQALRVQLKESLFNLLKEVQSPSKPKVLVGKASSLSLS